MKAAEAARAEAQAKADAVPVHHFAAKIVAEKVGLGTVFRGGDVRCRITKRGSR